MAKNSDTIFALATPFYKSAIALIRVSGPKSEYVLKKLTKIKKISANTMFVRVLTYKKIKIDQATVVFFKKPKSYTGEDMLEVGCHGGVAVINKILETLQKLGVRQAEKGEFTKRALLNDKVDLVQTESIADIVDSETDKQRQLALKNFNGGLSEFTNKVKKKLSKMVADIEAIIDFSDEDLPKNVFKKIKEQNKNLIKTIKKEIIASENTKLIREGFIISIIGKPNTGKSSFINFISKKDISIVTNLPGTTTDLVSSSLDIFGYKCTFYDTAGLRKHTNKVEEIGVRKSLDIVKKSHINLVFLEKNEIKKYKQINNKIFIRSKSDRKKNIIKDGALNISSKTGHGVDSLLKKIKQKLHKKNQTESCFSRERHINIMKDVLGALEAINFSKNIDITAFQLREALKHSLEINQKFDIEKILDIIFSDFCIGK